MWYLISSKSTVRSCPTFITDKNSLIKLQMCYPTNYIFLNNQEIINESFDTIPQHFDDDSSSDLYDSDYETDSEFDSSCDTFCLECEEFYDENAGLCPCQDHTNFTLLDTLLNMHNDTSDMKSVELHLQTTEEILMSLEDNNLNCLAHFKNLPQFQQQLIAEYGEFIGTKTYNSYIDSVNALTPFNVQSLLTDYLLPLATHADVNWIIKLLEDIGILVHFLCKSSSFTEYSMAILTFAKLRSDGPLLNSELLTNLETYFKRLFGSFEVQGVEECLSGARQYLDKFDEVKRSPIFTKLYKFSMYALSLSLFKKLGLTFDFLGYSRIEAEAIRKKHHRGVDFYRTMADTALFLCERGYQCLKTGEMDPIFHSGDVYQRFYDETTKLLRQSLLLNEPALYGFTEFEFLANLEKTIETGENIYKHATRVGIDEKLLVRVNVNKLLTVKYDLMTRSRARESRKPPFSILIYGDTSVGKSSITDMIFQYYGKLRGLPTASEYKYTRNPAANFADGFRTMQWCFQLDDIAFMNPDAAPNGDRSVLEILQLINAVPYVPDQAALEDKGRIPFRGELVIATTNRKDLHAHPYFSCPSAVQRRFPYVIDVKPKLCYRNAAGMLDSTKVGDIEFTDFPDLWDFTIEKVVPTSTRAVHIVNADYIIIHKDLSLREFLIWFKETVDAHHLNQDRVMRSVNKMVNVDLCSQCQLPPSCCSCASMEVQSKNKYTEGNSHMFASIMVTLTKFFTLCVYIYYMCLLWDLFSTTVFPKIKNIYYFIRRYWRKIWIVLYLQYRVIRWLVDFNNRWFFLKIRMQMWFYSHDASFYTEELRIRFERSWFKKLGDRVQQKIGYPMMLTVLVGFLASGIALYKFKSAVYSIQSETPMVSEEEESTDEDILEVEFEKHTLNESVGKTPTPDEGVSRINPWKIDDQYVYDSFDFSPLSVSWNALEKDQLVEKLARNCYYAYIRWINPLTDRNIYKIARITCLGGRIFMLNKHLLPPIGVDQFRIELRAQPNNSGVTSNRMLNVTRSEFHFDSSDVALVSLADMDVHRDIVDLFPTGKLDTIRHGGFILNRNEDTTIAINDIARFQYNRNYYCREFEHLDVYPHVDTWFSHASRPTIDGECGSLHIAMTGYGPVILGIHYLGFGHQVGCVDIRKEYITNRLKKFEEPRIQSSYPQLSSTLVKKELTKLHDKAVVGFIEEGEARVYGSFVGMGFPRGRTQVEISPMANILSDYGYKIKHGPPCLTGWEPKRMALIEMVNINNKMDRPLLKECAQSFLNDIMRELPANELNKLEVYDTFTAINGAASIPYVDKINRNTSAGYPWNKSKKHFMFPVEPRGDIMDPIMFNDDVMDRVEHMTDAYFKGHRNHLIFSASLKDEATSFLKIKNKKTRVFTGAPLDGTIVIRKFYLSFIRLIQNNRFVFECGAGTIAQSLEWEEIMKYLTKYGSNNMVAGDYKNFDKSMFAYIIWLSFWILIQLGKKSGNYSEKEILALYGIAEDIAFPTVNFFGELISFFGSNPSGHPLTVIINSIANSLYMRYAYAKLNPDKHCHDFKSSVSLMTYGDDNVMGVNPQSHWFNHTAIQRVLSECGITYTMAEKDAESKPFIHINDVSFLKRIWRFDEDIGAYVCPLDHESINKMLMVWKRSRNIDAKEQCVALITTVVREYFWYGKDIFLTKRALFQSIVPKLGLELFVQDSTFPTYEELRNNFWESSKHVKRN
jgi:hypothetical protein